MGSFNYTCAITRTAISNGDPVLYAQLNMSEYTTYEIKQRFLNSESNKRILDADDSKEEWMTRLLKIQYEQSCRFIRHLVIGNYNDSGSVEEYNPNSKLDKDEHWWECQFIVHAAAAEALIGESLDPSKLKEQFRTLVWNAHLARIQLFGHNLLGQQEYDIDELNMQEKVLEVTKEIITSKRQWREGERYEDDWEPEYE